MTERIVVYSDKKRISPFVARVLLALSEVGAQYTVQGIDLENKPAYFAEKINPAGKIPAITYGGPDVPPDQPSPESAKIPESVVILEFLADIFPASGLLPSSPVERAKVRLLVDAVDTRFQGPLFGFLTKGDTSEALTTALEQVQSLLPAGSEFAVGNYFTIADAALLPLLTTLNIILHSQHGGFKISERDHVLKEYQSERFEKIRSYFEKNKTKKNFQQAVAKEDVIASYYASKLPKAQ